MAVIIRSVTNLAASPIHIFIPGFDADHPPVIVAPSATLDLLSVITEDDLIAIQGQLSSYVTHVPPIFSVAATIDTALFEQGYEGGSSTPGGSNTQVQFNNNNSFGGSANLTWNGSELDVTGDISANRLIGHTSQIQLQPSADTSTGIVFAKANNTIVAAVDTINNVLDMHDHSITNVGSIVLTNLSSEPGSPVEGTIIYNSTTHQAELFNGSSWVILG